MAVSLPISSDLTPVKTPVAEKSCITDVKTVKLNYIWTINNFSFLCNSLSSPTFSADGYDKLKWSINVDKYQGWLSLYLHLISCDKPEVSAKFRISILNDKKKETNAQELQKAHTFNINSTFGYEKFIVQDDLFNKANGLLPENKLTIFCNVEFVVDIVHKNVVQLEAPECKLSEQLIGNDLFFDVTLAAGIHEFQAHKAVLADHSVVFAAIFEQEVDKSKLDRVTVTHVGHVVLKEMLRFIYTGKVNNLNKMAIDLLAAADRFALEKLKIMCEESLSINLSIGTAARTLMLADLHSANKLKSETMNFIMAHDTDVQKTRGWKKITIHPHLMAQLFAALEIKQKNPEKLITNKIINNYLDNFCYKNN